MHRVTSRQRLVSWDAFDATAGGDEDHRSSVELDGADPFETGAMIANTNKNDTPTVMGTTLAVREPSTTQTMTMTSMIPPPMMNNASVVRDEGASHLMGDDSISSCKQNSSAFEFCDTHHVSSDVDTPVDDDNVIHTKVEEDTASVQSEGGYMTCASRNDSAFFFSMDDDDHHQQPQQQPTFLDQNDNKSLVDVGYSGGTSSCSPSKRHRKKRDRDHVEVKEEATKMVDDSNFSSLTTDVHNYLSSPVSGIRRNVSFSTSAPEVIYTDSHINGSSKGYGINTTTHSHHKSHGTQDDDFGVAARPDIIFPYLPLESHRPRRNESCMSFLTACASADSMDDEATMNTFYLERNRSLNRRRSSITNEVTRLLTGCSGLLGSSCRGAQEGEECVAGLLELADDLKEIVFSFLIPTDVRALGATCRSLQALSRTSQVWSCILRKDFPLLEQVSQSYYKKGSEQAGNSNGVLFKYSDDFGVPVAPVPVDLGDNEVYRTNSLEKNRSTRSSANLSVLHSLAQPYPTHVDESFFQSTPGNEQVQPNNQAGTATASASTTPPSFQTYKYNLAVSENNDNKKLCIPVVQFIGQVGTGDRCVQSNLPFPSVRGRRASEDQIQQPLFFPPWPRHVAPHFGASVVAAGLRYHQEQTKNNVNALPKWCPQSLFDLVRRGGSSTMMCMEEGALSSAVTSVEQERHKSRENSNVVSTTSTANTTHGARRFDTLQPIAERTPRPHTIRGSAPVFTPMTTAAETLRRYGPPSPFAGVHMPSLPAMPVLPAMPSMPVSMRPPAMNPAQMMSRIWNLCGTTTLKPFVAPYVVERDEIKELCKEKGGATMASASVRRTLADGPIVEVNMSPRLFAYFEVTILPQDPIQEPNVAGRTDRESDDSSHTSSSSSSSDCIAIGLATRKFDARHKMPGWCPHSYGYHGDDGGIFHGAGDMLREFGPRFGSRGQTSSFSDSSNSPDSTTTTTVVGCGIDYANGGIFFTINGTFLGYGWRGISLDEPLYPTVGVDSNAPLELNFGHRPFTFDVTRAFGTHHKALIETIFHQQHQHHNNHQQHPSSLTAPLSSSI